MTDARFFAGLIVVTRWSAAEAIPLPDNSIDAVICLQAWHWVGKGNATEHKAMLEEELGRFERFQLAE